MLMGAAVARARLRKIAVIGAVIAGAAMSAAPAGAADEPDLTALLPTETSAKGIPRVFVDTVEHEASGSVLYRFDAVILNSGGALDVFRDLGNGHAVQAIWSGGVPNPAPDPNVAPTPAPNVTFDDRSPSGAEFVFSSAPGHNHWHFQSTARYELLLPGGGARLADKIGFCMFDTWNTNAGTRYFLFGYRGSGELTWCSAGHPQAGTFTRMGITRDYGDLYQAQTADQWVDMTGLVPGSHQLRATVNPFGFIAESSTANNTLTVTRTIPGTIAKDGARMVGPGGLTFPIAGSVVGAGIPSRHPSCTTRDQLRKDPNCYVYTSTNGPLTFSVVGAPQHGALTMLSGGGLTRSVRYVPDPGFDGEDSFRFVVRDGRGLTSQPATVTLNITSEQPPVTVVIDPGHDRYRNLQRERLGPGSSRYRIKDKGGATGRATGQREATVTMRVALRLRPLLESAGVNVVMTRASTCCVSKGGVARATIGNRSDAALVVQIHADGAVDPYTRGTATLYPAWHGRWTNDIVGRSVQAARLIQPALARAMGWPNRGLTATGNFSSFNWSDVPVVRSRVGYLTNSTDDRALATDGKLDRAAGGLRNGILAYLQARGLL